MAHDLIEKLNANAHLTPDEIVKAINHPRWLCMATMTPEQHAAIFDTEQVLVTSHDGVNWNIGTRNWTMWWELEECHSPFWARRHGHLCSEAEFKEGEWPTI